MVCLLLDTDTDHYLAEWQYLDCLTHWCAVWDRLVGCGQVGGMTSGYEPRMHKGRALGHSPYKPALQQMFLALHLNLCAVSALQMGYL